MPSPRLGPRLVVGGTHSGVGKTTVATGLLAALRHAGRRPAAAKVGPDFIDPGYHSLASGRPPRNLDPWICGVEAMRPLAARAAQDCDVLIVEGVMGLFDGAVDNTPSSTADLALILEAPVVLVVDASAVSTSVAALVHGYATFRPEVRLGGVILNQVGSPGHEILLREAVAPLGIPVLGALPRDDALRWRDRHLGLVPVAEHPDSVTTSLARLAGVVASHIDLQAVMDLAGSAPELPAGEVSLPTPGPPAKVAVAAGKAFTFTYTDTGDALRAAGCEPVTFDPLNDDRLPADVDGLVIGGGFPEVYAEPLAANAGLLADLREQVLGGIPTWAECGGLLLLSQGIGGQRLAGVVPAAATMTGRLTLGYRSVLTNAATPLGPAGTRLRGHEFHYSALEPAGEALTLSSRWGTRVEGWATPAMLATYLHHHPGGDPRAVESFAHRVALHRALRLA